MLLQVMQLLGFSLNKIEYLNNYNETLNVTFKHNRNV